MFAPPRVVEPPLAPFPGLGLVGVVLRVRDDPMSCKDAPQRVDLPPDVVNGQRADLRAQGRPTQLRMDRPHLAALPAHVTWRYYVAIGAEPDCRQPRPGHLPEGSAASAQQRDLDPAAVLHDGEPRPPAGEHPGHRDTSTQAARAGTLPAVRVIPNHDTATPPAEHHRRPGVRDAGWSTRSCGGRTGARPPSSSAGPTWLASTTTSRRSSSAEPVRATSAGVWSSARTPGGDRRPPDVELRCVRASFIEDRFLEGNAWTRPPTAVPTRGPPCARRRRDWATSLPTSTSHSPRARRSSCRPTPPRGRLTSPAGTAWTWRCHRQLRPTRSVSVPDVGEEGQGFLLGMPQPQDHVVATPVPVLDDVRVAACERGGEKKTVRAAGWLALGPHHPDRRLIGTDRLEPRGRCPWLPVQHSRPPSEVEAGSSGSNPLLLSSRVPTKVRGTRSRSELAEAKPLRWWRRPERRSGDLARRDRVCSTTDGTHDRRACTSSKI